MYPTLTQSTRDFTRISSRPLAQSLPLAGRAGRGSHWRRKAIFGFFGMLLLTSSLLWAKTATGGLVLHARETRVVAGDTLWNIAERQYPNDDPRDRIEQIQQLNQLGNSSLQVGQLLQLPD